MTPHDTMRDMLERYPMLFENKTDCYHQLFIVVGNGYKWKNGELIEIFNELERPSLTTVDMDDIMKETVDFSKIDIYPGSSTYSKLFTMPNNVTPEWYIAAMECKRNLLEQPLEKINDNMRNALKKMEEKTDG